MFPSTASMEKWRRVRQEGGARRTERTANNVVHEKKREVLLVKHSTSIPCHTRTLTALSHGLDNREINDSAQGQFAGDERAQTYANEARFVVVEKTGAPDARLDSQCISPRKHRDAPSQTNVAKDG
jgi:hypothetical protein